MKTLDRSGLLLQALEGFASGYDRLPPSNISAPELIGKCEIGASVSARPGVWAGAPAPEVRTALSVGGVPRRFPFVLLPEDDGKEVLVTDIASNDAGSASMTSERILARFPAPRAMGIPQDVSIGSDGGDVSIEAGPLFSGTSGGTWSVSSGGGSGLQTDVDQTGRVTIGGTRFEGRDVVSVTYANSGGSSAASFAVLPEQGANAAPAYDGALKAATAFVGDAFELSAGTAFTGGDLMFASAGLPAGLEIDTATGHISGTLGTIGNYTVTVTASNSDGKASGSFALEVSEKPLEAPTHTGPLGDIEAQVGDAVSVDTAAAFEGDSLTFTAAGYPAELEIDAGSGRISGTLATIGHFTVTVTASNSGGKASGSFALAVSEKQLEAPTYTGTLADLEAQVGDAVSVETAAAFTGESLAFISAGLPAGLDIDAGSGRISGTLASVGNYVITVTASNSGGTASGTFALAVSEAPLEAPTYTGTLAATAVNVGDALSIDAAAAFTGEDLIYEGRGLPGGVGIDPATGRITGAPASAGSFSVTVTARNSTGAASGSFAMVVAAPTGVTPAAPSYNGSAKDLVLKVGVGVSLDLSSCFTGADLSFGATGLPAGLQISAATGVIAGKPTAAGSATVTVTASNSGGFAKLSFTITTGDDAVVDGGDKPETPGAVSAQSTGLASNVRTATVNIGSDEPGRDVYFSVLVGGVEDSGLTVNGTTAGLSLIGADSYPSRAVQAYRATGLTGSTAAIACTGATDTQYLAAFRVVGYRPIGGDPWITGRRPGGDTLTTTLTATVPAGGAVLLHGKRYTSLSSSPKGTVIDEAASDAIRGHWINDTGSSTNVSFTFATSVAYNEKYAAALILEKAS